MLTLSISDSFDADKRADSDIEVCVRLININPGQNEELLANCRPLAEYSWLVNEIKINRNIMDIEAAVDKAVSDMPEDFVIRPFVITNRAEVKDMCLTEYDEEKTMQLFKEEGREEGREEGIRAFIEDKLEDGVLSEIICQKLMKRFGLDENAAKEYIIRFSDLDSDYVNRKTEN